MAEPIINWAKEVEDEQVNLRKEVGPNNEHKRKRQQSDSSVDSKRNKSNKKSSAIELETDPEILMRRQKQIDYGKNTVGYDNYLKQVPIEQRTRAHPQTPFKYYKYSRRSWDKLVKLWRLQLHVFDPKGDGGQSPVEREEDDIKREKGDIKREKGDIKREKGDIKREKGDIKQEDDIERELPVVDCQVKEDISNPIKKEESGIDEDGMLS